MHNIENVLYLHTHTSTHMLVFLNFLINTFTLKKLYEYFKYSDLEIDRGGFITLLIYTLTLMMLEEQQYICSKLRSQQRKYKSYYHIKVMQFDIYIIISIYE